MVASWSRRDDEAEVCAGMRGPVTGRTRIWVVVNSDLDGRHKGFKFPKGTLVESIWFVFDVR